MRAGCAGKFSLGGRGVSPAQPRHQHAPDSEVFNGLRFVLRGWAGDSVRPGAESDHCDGGIRDYGRHHRAAWIRRLVQLHGRCVCRPSITLVYYFWVTFGLKSRSLDTFWTLIIVLDSFTVGLCLDSYSVELCESWWRRHGNDQRHVEHGRLLPAGRRAVPRVLATREDRLMAAAGASLIVGSIFRPLLSTPMHL